MSQAVIRAILFRDFNTLNDLLSKPQNIKTLKYRDLEGNNVLHLAAGEIGQMYGDSRIVKLLLSLGPELLDQTNIYGETPLLYAIKTNVNSQNNSSINELISRGADLSIMDKGGNTVLHWAVKNGDLPLVTYLLENGVANVENDDNETPKDWAVYYAQIYSPFSKISLKYQKIVDLF